jgi:hypothetical protein
MTQMENVFVSDDQEIMDTEASPIYQETLKIAQVSLRECNIWRKWFGN